MKKVIFGATAALALAVVFTGVVAAKDHGQHGQSGDETTVANKGTIVLTVAGSKADTGDNMQIGSGGSMAMTTGNATSKAYGYSNVNSTFMPASTCYMPGGRTTTVRNTYTGVGTAALSEADTGDNLQVSRDDKQSSSCGSRGCSKPSMQDAGRQMMTTGNASSAGYADSYVNMTDMSIGIN